MQSKEDQQIRYESDLLGFVTHEDKKNAPKGASARRGKKAT